MGHPILCNGAAAASEDPDVIYIGEMRDLETTARHYSSRSHTWCWGHPHFISYKPSSGSLTYFQLTNKSKRDFKSLLVCGDHVTNTLQTQKANEAWYRTDDQHASYRQFNLRAQSWSDHSQLQTSQKEGMNTLEQYQLTSFKKVDHQGTSLRQSINPKALLN